MKVVSTQMAFVNGRRYRPGQVFEIPDNHKLGAGMSKVEEGKEPPKKAEPKLGDTKPADAKAAVKAKTGGANESGASGLV